MERRLEAERARTAEREEILAEKEAEIQRIRIANSITELFRAQPKIKLSDFSGL